MNDRQGRMGGIVAGVVLVLLGVVFLVRDTISIDWGLVWPFALILPGGYVFGRALFARDHRDRTAGFIGGAILLFLGGIFLVQNWLSLDWGKIWPFFLIIPGVGLLLGAFLGWGRGGGDAAASRPPAGPLPPAPPPGAPPAGG